MSNDNKIIEAVDTLASIMADFEGRLVALEKAPAPAPVTPEQRAVVLAKKRWIPKEGTQAHAVLTAIVQRDGTWNAGRVLDVLRDAGVYPDSTRPDSVASGILGLLTQHNYLKRVDFGLYSKVGADL